MKKARSIKESLFKYFFFLNGVLAVLVLLGIFLLLLSQGVLAFREISLMEFLTSANWNPTSFVRPTYGILSMVVSTLMVTGLALILAIPLGIGCASYIAEVSSPRVKEIAKPVVEVLAAIPSVVIGFVGIVLVAPFLTKIFGISSGLNALNGAILLSIMSLPTIISISEDAITSVPKEYKEASLALGASRWETLVKVIIPSASSGIIASIMLGMGRAIGETMTVLMVTGNAPAMPHSLFDSIRTMTATIAIELGEVPYNTTHYYALFAIGLTLFLITFLVNLISDIILNKGQR
jgi:phosphate transport system permease protein